MIRLRNLKGLCLIAMALFLSQAANAASGGRLLDILKEAQTASCDRTVAEESTLESLLPSLASPELFFATERFEVEPLSEKDIPQLIPILTHPEVAEMSGDYLAEQYVAQLIRQGSQSAANLHPGLILNFGIWKNQAADKSGSARVLIGMTQLAITSPYYALEKGVAKFGETWMEVSYHLHPSFWGKGVASEITERTKRLAFETFKVDGLHAQTIGANHASGKVLTKLGMELVGEATLMNGPGNDQHNKYYAITKAAYFKARISLVADYSAKLAPTSQVALALMSDQDKASFFLGFENLKDEAAFLAIGKRLTDIGLNVGSSVFSNTPEDPLTLFALLHATRAQIEKLLQDPILAEAQALTMRGADRDKILERANNPDSLIQAIRKLRASAKRMVFDLREFEKLQNDRESMPFPDVMGHIDRHLVNDSAVRAILEKRFGDFSLDGDEYNPYSNKAGYEKIKEIRALLLNHKYMDIPAVEIVEAMLLEYEGFEAN